MWDDAKHAAVQLQKRSTRAQPSFAVMFTSLGTASFLLSAFIFMQGDIGDAEIEAEFAAKVDAEAYTWPMVAFGTAFCLNFLTLLFERESAKCQLALLTCYINFLAGLADYLQWKGLAPTIRGPWGHGVQIVRLTMYLHTTPAMVYLLSIVSDFSRTKVLYAMAADIGMLSCHIFAELCVDRTVSAISYGLAYVMFGYVMHQMWHMFDAPLSTYQGTHVRTSMIILRNCSVGLWFLFPLLWIVSRVGLLDVNLEEWLWTTGDFLGKVVFSSSLLFGNFLTIEQRRMIAMRVVEESNRVKVIHELQELVEQKESFLSSMSHELRTPLNGIIGLSDALLIGSCGEIEDRVHKTILTIKTSGSRLLTLVNDILDAASMKRGKLSVKHERVSIAKLADDVIDLCQPLAKRGVRLVKDISSDFLPPALGDTGRIIQILHNLIGNACKFTHSGYISISARLTADKKSMEVSVADTGIGIPEEKFNQIFRAFEQVDMSTTRKYGGTGLGLNLVKQLVEAHGGTIAVTSKVGVGTRFSFKLKLWDDASHKNDDNDSVTSNQSRTSTQPKQPAPALVHPMSAVAAPMRRQAPQRRSSSLQGQVPRPPPSVLSESRFLTGTSVGTSIEGGGARRKPLRAGSHSSLLPTEPVHDALLSEPTTGAVGLLAPALPYKVGTNIMGPVSLEDAATLASLKVPLDFKEDRLRRRRTPSLKPKILSVDDDPINQMVIHNLLGPAGYELVQAMNGEEAIDLLRDETALPDAILLDVMMPGMSGYDVCRKLREMHPLACIPVIMVSAKSKEEHIVEGLTSGSNDYMVKPFGRQEILARIAAHINFKETAFQAAEIVVDQENAARSSMDNLKLFLSIESSQFSLPQSFKLQMKDNKATFAQLQVFHSLTMLVVEIVNLNSMIQHLNIDELAVALTTLYLDMEDLVEEFNCYPVDMNDGAIIIVCGVNGEQPDESARNALRFASGVLEVASKIFILESSKVEVSIGIHAAVTQAMAVGIKRPMLMFPGHLHEIATQLQGTCPSGCIHVSQRVYDLVADEHQFVATMMPRQDNLDMTYLVKEGSWEVNLPFMPVCFEQYASSNPAGPLDLECKRQRPVQLAMIKLISADPQLVFELMGTMGRLRDKDPALLRAPTVDQTPVDDSKLKREKEMLEQQLEEVSEEAGRLQDELDQLQATLKATGQVGVPQKERVSLDVAEHQKEVQSLKGQMEALNQHSHDILGAGQQAEVRAAQLQLRVDQLTSECLEAEAHAAGLEDQVEVAFQQVTALDEVVGQLSKEKDVLVKKQEYYEAQLMLTRSQQNRNTSGPMTLAPRRKAPSRDPSEGSNSDTVNMLNPRLDITRLAVLDEMGLTRGRRAEPHSVTGSRLPVASYNSFGSDSRVRGQPLRLHRTPALMGEDSFDDTRSSGTSAGQGDNNLENQLVMRFEQLGSAHMSISNVLAEIGLSELSLRFESEEVTPALLPHLKDADLRDIGVSSMGSRLLLRLAGKALRRSGKI